MAIGWLTVLKLVPWGDVIENAPKVAQGAKKLWDKVGKKPVADAATEPHWPATGAEPTLAQLQAQVSGLQLATADLHQQMLDCTELVKTLAEQNSQLVKRVETNRKRVLWLAVLWLVLAVAQLLWFGGGSALGSGGV